MKLNASAKLSVCIFRTPRDDDVLARGFAAARHDVIDAFLDVDSFTQQCQVRDTQCVGG